MVLILCHILCSSKPFCWMLVFEGGFELPFLPPVHSLEQNMTWFKGQRSLLFLLFLPALFLIPVPLLFPYCTGMILGLCMIALTLQPKLEILLLKGLLWGPDARMQTLIRKNLASHRSRSRKTAFMFIIAIGFMSVESSLLSFFPSCLRKVKFQKMTACLGLCAEKSGS